jgi:hypothetical protein
MSEERITYLLRKRLESSISLKEDIELSKLIAATDDAELSENIRFIWDEYNPLLGLSSKHSKQMLAKILGTFEKNIPSTPIQKLIPTWIRYSGAAVLIFAVVGASYFYLFKNNEKKLTANISFKGDVAPGRQGAKLKLSDGRIVLIDSAKDGLIATQGGLRIYKKNGKIIYEGSSQETVFNEIITDNGRQWTATLPDGSITWLNAASSIRYPLKFSDKERLVEMTGEVSFKVVHNSLQPFRIKCGAQVIEDIGTEFNVNAYGDESVLKTTIIEGSASVANGNKKVIVIAGEEATINTNSQDIKVSKANIDASMAWRKGLFSFKDANIQTVMKQIGRWYDVEVKYEGDVPLIHDFSGKMGRNMTLAQTLKALKSMHVNFRIEEDKRIVIMP